jgi:predicted PhzF superfamily epimerase YddE/YHI9
VEDPVTGSLNASVAQWLISTGRIRAPYVASQGTAIGRAGRVLITQDADGTVWTGGRSSTLIRGTVTL